MEPTLLIRNARAIVTCDSRNRIIRDADILVRGGRIKAIGQGLSASPAGAAPAPSADTVIDARGMFVYPGLVNTHHHFFQTFVRNLMAVDYPNLSVMDWIARIYEIFKLIDSDSIYYSSLVAMTDLMKHGCTTAFDHQYCFPRHAGPGLVDRQMDAAALLGIRYIAGRGANTLPRSEGSTIPDEMLESTDEFLADCDRLISKYGTGTEPLAMTGLVVSPCQPINCRKETFVESIRLARSRGARLHTHLGEGEDPGMLARWGKRTLAWCEDIGFAGPDVWYAHGWDLNPDEYRAMASAGTALSHCPAPAVLGGFPILDIRGMRDAGLTLSLGCDGSATNDGSNLLDSLRMAYLMQAWHAKKRGGCASPYDLLKIATAGGAATLGRSDIGSLEAGKAADLFMVDASTLDLAGATHDPGSILARVGVTGPVALTMVNGRVIWRDGQLLGASGSLDERQLATEADAACDRAIRNRIRLSAEALGLPHRTGGTR